jgi:hypothetical protein
VLCQLSYAPIDDRFYWRATRVEGMAGLSQRRALGALFLLLAAAFAGVAYAGANAGAAAGWIVAAAAGVLALWLAGLSFRALRRG